MGQAVLTAVANADALFMVAAVADFRPGKLSERKLKKTEADDWGLAIGLEVTLDILSAVKEQREKTGYPRVSLWALLPRPMTRLNTAVPSCCVKG
jgi:phosphopantothenoylcysteine synthetase/decarboxylase